ncbi:MAG: helix-turn-helix domain-containing protein [Sphingobacteriia bacterium]|nr:helix-turn-helix domain-containing protein [Sphingobacteriia bacterium]
MVLKVVRMVAFYFLAVSLILPDITFIAAAPQKHHEADSMLNLLTISPDRLKPKIYLHLSEILLPTDTLQSMIYARHALELAHELKIHQDQLWANHQLSKIYFHFDSMRFALEHSQEALRISEKLKVDKELKPLIETLTGECLYLRAACYRQLYPDSVQSILIDLIDATEKLKNSTLFETLANIHQLLGQQYLDINIFDKGIEHLRKAIEYYEIIDNKSAMAYLYMQLSYRTDRATGLQYAQKSINLYTQANDSLGMARNLIHMAYQTRKILDKETNLNYVNLAYSIYEEFNDYPGMVYALFHLATYHCFHLSDSTTGLKYLKKGAEIALKHQVTKSAGHIFVTLGSFYKNRQQYDSAAYYFHIADSITRFIPAKPERIRFLTSMGEFYTELQKTELAGEYLQKALEMAEKTDEWQLTEIIYQAFYTLYKQNGDFEQALYYFERRRDLLSRMINQSTERAIAEMQIRYETARVEHTLDMMKKNEALKNAELQRKQMTIYSITSGLLLIMAFSALLSWHYLVKRKAYEKLMEKNLELINTEKRTKLKEATDQNEGLPLDPTIHKQIANRMNYQIRKNKIFLKSELTLNGLAKKCRTNSSYLSKFINQEYETNFNGFINELRIREAQKMMADERYKSYSIEGISSTVGFKTKSVFNNSFKKITGVTPSYYLTYLNEKKSHQGHLSPGSMKTD